MIKDAGLRSYADLLERHGFAIYESRRLGTFFLYSRIVNGQECFGCVQYGYGGYSHSMPIKPSQQHGSSMFVEGVVGELTIEAATKVTSPTNYNHLVGVQENHREDDWTRRLYVKRFTGRVGNSRVRGLRSSI